MVDLLDRHNMMCGSPKPDLREHTQGLVIYFPGILIRACSRKSGGKAERIRVG